MYFENSPFTWKTPNMIVQIHLSLLIIIFKGIHSQKTSNESTDSSNIVIDFDRPEVALLRLNNLLMRTSSNITEILALQNEEFKVNPNYMIGWNTATRLFNTSVRKRIFNRISVDSIAQNVPAEYHIALIAYTIRELPMSTEFTKATRELLSDSDIDKYQWKSYFKLLQLAVKILGSREERWKHNRRIVYSGAVEKYDLSKGQRFTFQQFVSSSVSRTIAESFAGASLFELHGHYNGTAMAIWDHSAHEEEREILFSPLQVFRVVSIHVGSRYTRYVLGKHR